LLGGSECSVYDVSVRLIEDSVCTDLTHEGKASTLSTATELIAGHQELSSCEANSWVDFYLKIDSTEGKDSIHPSRDNIIFEVTIDPSSQGNHEALSIYLHLGEIPVKRDSSEFFDKEAIDGVLSLAIPANSVADDVTEVALSVRCGSTAVRFKAAAIVIHSDLKEARHSYGEICSGEWVTLSSYFTKFSIESFIIAIANILFEQVYYEFRLPHDSATSTVRFDVTKYEGTVSFMARLQEQPIRLAFPFVSLVEATEEESTSVFACNVVAGETVYLGARGGDHCATFTVTPLVNASAAAIAECSEETNADLSISEREDTLVTLDEGSWQYGHCSRGGWSGTFFSIDIRWDLEPTNLMLELEDLGDDGAPGVLDPNAFSVYVFDGEPPQIAKRETSGAYRLLSLVSKNGIHPIILNYLEIKKIVDNLVASNSTKTTLSIAMKCSANRELVRFRGMRSSFRANATIGMRTYSEVCPLGWVYHFVDLTSIKSSNNQRRRLGSDSLNVSTSIIRFKLRILQGGIYQVSSRLNHAPGFNSANQVNLELTAGSDPSSTIASGNEVGYEIDICDAHGQIAFIGLFGDESGCAQFSFEFHQVEEDNCVSTSRNVVSLK